MALALLSGVRVQTISLIIALLTTPLVASAGKVDTWAYQLQQYDEELLMAVAVDLFVVDPDAVSRAKIQVSSLKANNGPVLAYVSVGEAEAYRAYWQPSWRQAPPAWMAEENPAWNDNFKVEYWNSEWQAITILRVEAMARTGYDGMYLDIVDAYQYFEERGERGARDELVEFVVKLFKAARAINPQFTVVAQNAAELFEDEEYNEVVDGIANEDTFYNGDQRQRPNDVQWTVKKLKSVKESGKLVLNVEYTTRCHSTVDFCRRSQEGGFVPLVAPRQLDGARPDHATACIAQTARIAQK